MTNLNELTQEVTISINEYIELLEFKLYSKIESEKEDSSWNYGIEELKEEITNLKKLL